MLPAGTHRECWPLRGGPFRRWIARLYFEQKGTAPGSQALQDALGVLEGMALFRSDEYEVHLRLAEHDGAVYLDLADDYWQAVRITANGWEVVHAPPVRFRRSRGMRQLPHPTRGGNIDELREYANVGDDDWPLFTSLPRSRRSGLAARSRCSSFTASRAARRARPRGSCASSSTRTPHRSAPSRATSRDLMIASHNGWIVTYDNVSHLAPWLSDAICRLSTGGGFATRELYSNTDEILIDVQRPVVMNGIEDLAIRGDLLDRSLILYLPGSTVPAPRTNSGRRSPRRSRASSAPSSTPYRPPSRTSHRCASLVRRGWPTSPSGPPQQNQHSASSREPSSSPTTATVPTRTRSRSKPRR